jgi:EmrB/QacA subfamily drug resistance transporter
VSDVDNPVAAPGSAFGVARDPRRWWILVVVSLAQLMIVVDLTIVNIALPAAQRDLGFSDASRQWVITAYALAFGSLLLIGGRVADRLGRRTALLIGLVVFGVGSGLGGAAPDFAVLLIARVLQGAGGALLAPAALATMTVTFVDPKERATGFSVFGAIGAVGGAVGLLLGGVLTEHVDWRSTLFVNLGIAAVTLVGALAVIERDVARERKRLDVLGTVLVSLGVFALVFGFNRAQTNGWGATETWASLAASVILLSMFGWWQTRADNPLLPLRILLDRDRGASLSALMLANVGMFGVFLFLTYYLQLTLHYSPVKTGEAFMPLIGGTIAGAGLGLQFLPRFVGPRFIVPGGMLIAAACLAWLTRLGFHTGYWAGIFPPLLVLGLGMGLIFPPAISLSSARLHDDDNGVGGALVNTTQQVGGSVGIALLSTLAASAATAYLKSHHGPKAVVMAHATVHSYAVAYWIAAGIFAVGAVTIGSLYRPGIPAELRPSDTTEPAPSERGARADESRSVSTGDPAVMELR